MSTRKRITGRLLLDLNGSEVVKDLLYSHPELKQTGDAKDVDKRLRVVSFFARAKMLDMASAELDRILKDFPAEKERVQAKRKEFQKFVVARFVDLIELANKTGRHTWAQTRLATVPPNPGTRAVTSTSLPKCGSSSRQPAPCG